MERAFRSKPRSPDGRKVVMQTGNGDRMKRVVVDYYRGPEVLRIMEDEVPRPGLTDAHRAHELLESSADKGKLVLVP